MCVGYLRPADSLSAPSIHHPKQAACVSVVSRPTSVTPLTSLSIVGRCGGSESCYTINYRYTRRAFGYILSQCSKLRMYSMHAPGGCATIILSMHPALFLWVHFYINILKVWGNHEPAGCTCSSTYAPGHQNTVSIY